MRPVDADYIRGTLEAEFGREDDDLDDRQWAYGYAAGVDFSIRKLAEVPTLTLPNEWVSVEERLPTDERPVLVFIGYADTMTGFITTSSYFCFDANPHWQWDGLTQDEQKTLFWMPFRSRRERRGEDGQERGCDHPARETGFSPDARSR